MTSGTMDMIMEQVETANEEENEVITRLREEAASKEAEEALPDFAMDLTDLEEAKELEEAKDFEAAQEMVALRSPSEPTDFEEAEKEESKVEKELIQYRANKACATAKEVQEGMNAELARRAAGGGVATGSGGGEATGSGAGERGMAKRQEELQGMRAQSLNRKEGDEIVEMATQVKDFGEGGAVLKIIKKAAGVTVVKHYFEEVDPNDDDNEAQILTMFVKVSNTSAALIVVSSLKYFLDSHMEKAKKKKEGQQ
jgi:hypothetical protein